VLERLHLVERPLQPASAIELVLQAIGDPAQIADVVARVLQLVLGEWPPAPVRVGLALLKRYPERRFDELAVRERRSIPGEAGCGLHVEDVRRNHVVEVVEEL
jgi:hypothetical protein